MDRITAGLRLDPHDSTRLMLAAGFHPTPRRWDWAELGLPQPSIEYRPGTFSANTLSAIPPQAELRTALASAEARTARRDERIARSALSYGGTAAITTEHVKEAMERLHYPRELAASALNQLLGLSDHDVLGGSLQRLLTEHVGRLASSADVLECEAGQLLRDYYVRRVGSQEEVADRLHLSRTTFYRRLHLGWSLLGELLASQFYGVQEVEEPSRRRELLMELFARVGLRRSWWGGAVIRRAEDPVESVHLIAQGCVATAVTAPTGFSLTFQVLGLGEMFGEASLLPPSDITCDVAVRALVTTETLAIDRERLAVMRRNDPRVAELLIDVLASHADRLAQQLVRALHTPADERVLYRIMELAEVFGQGRAKVALPVTQADLAELAGTARATVNRVLQAGAAHHLLRSYRSRIEVQDLPTIRRILDRRAAGGRRRSPGQVAVLPPNPVHLLDSRGR